MDKVKINNQVVLMRKFVKQAKVHLVNKLTKNIKLYQCKKGTEDQILKNKRRVERLLEEVAIMKKIKPDSVSKLALSKAKDWKTVLLQKNIPLEDRCYALLSNYEAVQKEVDKFYSTNTESASQIPLLVKEWEDKTQIPGRHVKKRRIKKVISGSNSEPLQNQSVTSNTSNKIVHAKIHDNHGLVKTSLEKVSGEIDAVDNSDEDKNSETDTDHSNSKMETNVKEISLESFPVLQNITETSNESEPEAKTSKVKSQVKKSMIPKRILKFSNVVKKPKPSPTNSKNDDGERAFQTQKSLKSSCKNSLKAISVLDLDELKDCDEIPLESNLVNVEKLEQKEKRKSDPFFLTSDGEVVSDSNVEEPEIKSDIEPLKDQPRKFARNEVYQKQRIFGHSQDDIKQKNSFQNNRRKFEPRTQTSSFSGPNEFKKNFYDSSKSKNTLKFKDRSPDRNKYRTSNDSSSMKSSRFNPKYPNETQQKKNESSSKKQVPEKPLHPSWEAKRKLKEANAVGFQGKKKIFTD